MKRKMVEINEERCNGCGLCITGCHEGALQLIDGKAKLVSDSYCDGLGACLPACPVDAISLVEREADEFDEEAVLERIAQMKQDVVKSEKPAFVCPGSAARAFEKKAVVPQAVETSTPAAQPQSELRQWPCQIKLVPVNAPYFDGAHLLIAADCAAYAYANFHQEFIKNKITIIGCPKLDEGDYSEKLTTIISNNAIKSVTIVRMVVPCCGGLEHAAVTALKNSGKMIPWKVVTISTEGNILED